jgi:hypothetical protein
MAPYELYYEDDERPFADPYYWAGFVFTGSDRSDDLSGNERSKTNIP